VRRIPSASKQKLLVFALAYYNHGCSIELMKDQAAVEMLGALAQEHRIRIYRRLVKAGPPGLPSSDIAEVTGISPTSASFHLKEMVRTGLLISTRQGRFIRYAIHINTMRKLLTYLTEDCCQGQPELCGPVTKPARRVCAPQAHSKVKQ
jgi:DNA-binding transcriptional ArsR family regulator